MMQSVGDLWEYPNLNWCGIANLRVISLYDWFKYNDQYPPQNSQTAIYNMLNSPYAVSAWGRAAEGSGKQYGQGGPYVVADIAADGGTDPRAIAYGAYTDTPPGYYFHNWIYRTDSTTATYYFSSDFGQTNGVNDPTSVTINGGLHSFVIDGVWANHDPSGTGATIYYIDTWDPWLSSGNEPADYQQPGGPHWYYNSFQNQAWPISQWTSFSQFWGQGYNPYNNYDPEPNTTGGNYYNSPPLSAHWGGYFTTIEQDNIGNYGPDFAFDQNGNLAPHT